MKNYEKPIVLVNSELSEGVYAGSGNCYTVSAYIHQTPQEGRGDYRMQLYAAHAADGHHSGAQYLTISFNQPVKYVLSNGTLKSGDGSSTLMIEFNYHNNANDYIGLGDLVVTSDEGLAITSSSLGCNYDCGQH